MSTLPFNMWMTLKNLPSLGKDKRYELFQSRKHAIKTIKTKKTHFCTTLTCHNTIWRDSLTTKNKKSLESLTKESTIKISSLRWSNLWIKCLVTATIAKTLIKIFKSLIKNQPTSKNQQNQESLFSLSTRSTIGGRLTYQMTYSW